MTPVMLSLPNVHFKGYYMDNITMCKCTFSSPEVLGFGNGGSKKLSLLGKQGSSHCFSGKFSVFSKGRADTASPSNAYVGRDSSRDKIYKRFGSCLVIPPTNGKKPHAIIKFLGGAFIGAVPEVTYSHLTNLLAKEGFIIISVPYNVTFNHAEAAKEVYEKFNACMDVLLSSGLPDANIMASDLLDVPVYSVGHSNGALLQLLAGSYFSEKIPKANAVISYNNRPAAEAVPYFEQLGPLISQLMPLMEASPMYAMARNTTDDALKTVLDTAGTMLQEYDQEAMVSLTKFIDQLPLVMNQVSQGISEFKPTPLENRNFVKSSYNVPLTLLVKFNVDPIDETDILEEVLKLRVDSIGGTLEKVILTGNHLTPCVQDIKWQVGDLYTPADALAQGLKTLSLSDTRVLARTISDWFKSLVMAGCRTRNLLPLGKELLAPPMD